MFADISTWVRDFYPLWPSEAWNPFSNFQILHDTRKNWAWCTRVYIRRNDWIYESHESELICHGSLESRRSQIIIWIAAQVILPGIATGLLCDFGSKHGKIRLLADQVSHGWPDRFHVLRIFHSTMDLLKTCNHFRSRVKCIQITIAAPLYKTPKRKAGHFHEFN